MEKKFEIKLVNPMVWHVEVERAFSGLPSRLQSMAFSILRTIQNHHIGITPKLAAELAQLMDGSYAPQRGKNPWHNVLKRLQLEITDSPISFGLLLNANPAYSVIHLAKPILGMACQQMGLCYLFCEDDIKSHIDTETYREYSLGLEREINEIIKNDSNRLNLFWTDGAMTLASLSRRNIPGEDNGNLLPETDVNSLAILMRLNPKISKSPPLHTYSRLLSDPLQHREVSHLREGGFSGIHISRREEDISDILLSEFTNPPAVLADRMINNGFLALRRQTQREQLRDVLIVGMMPGIFKSKLNTDFIKACWFHLIHQLGNQLLKSGRISSEFRWLEGNNQGDLRSCNFILKDLPLKDFALKNPFKNNNCKEFLMSLGWLPLYMDSFHKFEPMINRDPSPDGENQKPFNRIQNFEDAKQWAFFVWRNQKENLKWLTHEDSTPHQNQRSYSFRNKSNKNHSMSIDRFAMVHIMLLLPDALQRTNNNSSFSTSLGLLYKGFGLGNFPSRNISITWIPDDIKVIKDWAFDCRGKANSSIFPGTISKEKLNSHLISSGIINGWKKQLIKEIRNPLDRRA